MKICKARIDSILLEGAKFILNVAALASAIALMLAAVGAEVELSAMEFMVGVGVAWAPLYLMVLMSSYPHERKGGVGLTWRMTADQMKTENLRFLHDYAKAVSGLVIYLLALLFIYALIEFFKILIGLAVGLFAYFSLFS